VPPTGIDSASIGSSPWPARFRSTSLYLSLPKGPVFRRASFEGGQIKHFRDFRQLPYTGR